MTKKEIKIKLINQINRRINGIISLPTAFPSDSDKMPAVIICHGFKGHQNEGHILAVNNALTKIGFISVRFDFTNNLGSSEGKFEDLTLSQELQDLAAIFNFVRKCKSVNEKRIGLIGHSLGAFVSAAFVADHKNVKSLVLLSPVFDLKKAMINQLGKNGFQNWERRGSAQVKRVYTKGKLNLNYLFWQDAQDFNPQNIAKKIICPLMVIHGDQDRTIAQSDGKKWFNLSLSEKRTFKLIEKTDHNYQKGCQLELVTAYTINWLQSTV